MTITATIDHHHYHHWYHHHKLPSSPLIIITTITGISPPLITTIATSYLTY
jgi:hypothetical protein